MAATLTLFSLHLPHKKSVLLPSSTSPTNFPSSSSSSSSSSPRNHLSKHQDDSHRNKLHQILLKNINPLQISSFPTAAALTLPFFVDPQVALAAGGEFGILEGRTLALVHPIVMATLFGYTLWAGYLGWQWRRVRTVQDEINELKKQVKPSSPESEAAEDLVLDSKIKELTEERKKLIKGSYRERHFNAGSILLGFGVLEAVGGGVNTWLRTGQLFPGPHLFAGAAITVLWASAAALVPSMQKGSETARNLHIALNTLNVLLFVGQIPTGIEIVFKVFEFTNWP